IVDQHVERPGRPNGINHGVDRVEAANIAGKGVDGSACKEFGGCGSQDFFAPSANVYRRPKFEKALRHAFAEARASAGDEDALVFQKVGAEHYVPPVLGRSQQPAGSYPGVARFGMTNYRGWAFAVVLECEGRDATFDKLRAGSRDSRRGAGA